MKHQIPQLEPSAYVRTLPSQIMVSPVRLSKYPTLMFKVVTPPIPELRVGVSHSRGRRQLNADPAKSALNTWRRSVLQGVAHAYSLNHFGECSTRVLNLHCLAPGLL